MATNLLLMLVALAALALAAVVCWRALRTADVAGERLERFFNEHADRLQGVHVATQLGEHIPPRPVSDIFSEADDNYAEAAKAGLDLRKPEDVTTWNRLLEEAYGARGMVL